MKKTVISAVMLCLTLHVIPVSAIELYSNGGQSSKASAVWADFGGKNGLGIIFQGTEDLHFYADESTAPGGMNLTIIPRAQGITFARPTVPIPQVYHDKASGTDLDVYAGNFSFFFPIENIDSSKTSFDVSVEFKGIACTSVLCLPPLREKVLTTTIDTTSEPMKLEFTPAVKKQSQPAKINEIEKASVPGSSQINSINTPAALLLAFAAGILINLMPCVLPVIPIIIMRFMEQAKESARKRILLGEAFCGGILLFFIIFAAAAAVIKAATGTAINWTDAYRYPNIVTGMFIAIVLFALFLLDVFTIGIPSSIASKQGSATGVAGSVSMGFFAAVLSTPCSGALLGFVLMWAQTQPMLISTAAIILMGTGMALPYLLLVIFPKLMGKMPKPGTWMEIFRKAMGLLLLYIGIKLMLPALPKDQLLNVIKFAVVLSLGIWMWGQWVSFSTPVNRKILIRAIALTVIIAGAFIFLPSAEDKITVDWTDYERALIENAKSDGTPVLIKFTADWCSNCKIVDKRVYHDEKVIDKLKEKGVLTILADTTNADMQATKDLKEIYKIPGTVPVTVLLLPNSEPVLLLGIFNSKDLFEHIDKLPGMEK